jgi:hypothetical protein
VLVVLGLVPVVVVVVFGPPGEFGLGNKSDDIQLEFHDLNDSKFALRVVLHIKKSNDSK